MYVVAAVDAGTIQNAIAVPDSAVLRDSENQPFVYVEVSGNQFGRRSRHSRGKHERTNASDQLG